MTKTSPGSTTDPADFTRTPAIDARPVPIDLGLIDAVTDEILAHPMALSDPPLYNPPRSVFRTFLSRRRRHPKARHPSRPRSHHLRDLDMLAASAERLRAILTRLDASQHADLMRELFNPLKLPQPQLLRATRTTQGLVELLDLLAANARQEFRARGGLKPAGKARLRTQGTQPKRKLAEQIPPRDVEARLKALALAWFGREELGSRLADVALRCRDYRDGLRSEPPQTDTLETFRQARHWSDHTMVHLLKFPFRERLALLSYRPMAEARATIETGVLIDQPAGAVRRLRALCRLLLAVGDRGAYSIEQDVAGTRYGRRDMSDPATFAVTCCASLWIAFRNEAVRGRYPKTGTFSRFVQEFLHDTLEIFPASELGGALRRFHDARDEEIRRIAERLQAPPPAVSGSAAEPDAATLEQIRRLLNTPVSG